jgi:hypothetical protein
VNEPGESTMKADAFKPASGSKEARVVQAGPGLGGPELGDHFRIAAQPTPVRPAPMAVKQGGEQFVPASQPVQLAGQPPAAPPGGAPAEKFQPAAPPQQVMQPPQPGMGAPQPQPFPHRAPPQQQGNEVFSVSIVGVDASGQEFVAPMGEVEMPRGLQLGARIQPLG